MVGDYFQPQHVQLCLVPDSVVNLSGDEMLTLTVVLIHLLFIFFFNSELPVMPYGYFC